MRLYISSFIVILFCSMGFSQNDSLRIIIADEIKSERNEELNILRTELKRNESEISKLTEELSAISKRKTKEKVEAMEKLQVALDNRIRFLEESPKTEIGYNGQLAFTELLSIQRDIQPADLFLQSQNFFSKMGEISNLQDYQDFKSWKKEYDDYYERKKGSDKTLEFINKSLGLVTDASNKVPLYGSIVNTTTSGISSLLGTLGGRHKELAEKTPDMLEILATIGQFEQQKAIIDHEWILINKELEQLKEENTELLESQLDYYGMDKDSYKKEYLKATLDNDRDDYKRQCREQIQSSLAEMDKNPNSEWLEDVEIYMYKVQSLRLRFGELTSRMLNNIDKYNELIAIFSDNKKFPVEFTNKLASVSTALQSVRSTFYKSFNPAKYIQDSTIMYLEREN